MTPVVGDIIESTVGKVVDRLMGKYLPSSMGEKEREEMKLEARRLATEEYKTAIADVQGARELASREAEGSPGWTKALAATHRPAWSFLTLAIFAWTVAAPYAGFGVIPLTEIHKDIMQTVIVFYFGGRSIEKAIGYMKGGGWTRSR